MTTGEAMSGEWAAVRLTGARQVAELVGLPREAWPDAETGVQAHYAMLRAAGDDVAALAFIGHALPRLEVVTWAARILDAESRTRLLDFEDRQALDRALRWLGAPDDAGRRETYEAALEAGDRAPERLLGFAVFFSGGSMSQPELPAVLPPPEACARCAVGAVTLAAHRSDDPAAALLAALALAEAVAARGVAALAPA